LSISQRLVELMCGELQVESREYEGSKFFFTIEFDSADHLFISPDSKVSKTSQSRTLHILVAEDNSANRFIAVKLLEILGHTVELAETGKEVIAKLAENHFDVVFMDIRMPEMTGDEATRIIRNDTPEGVDPNIPIIALTAYALKDEIDRFMQSGFSAYLTKPLDVTKINKVLSKL
jgi:CheY-like chemotaxis protein